MVNHPNRSVTRDQNGHRLTKTPVKVVDADGNVGWARQVWFGSCPATNVRWYVYSTKSAALNGDISDTYDSCSDLCAVSRINYSAA
jgi:hypothetical protein